MEGNCRGYDYGVEEQEEEEGCRTPTHEGCRIPAEVCPPAPRKKRVYMKQQQRSVLPKDGYFRHPDLELLFKMMTTTTPITRESYVQFEACLERLPGTACYQI